MHKQSTLAAVAVAALSALTGGAQAQDRYIGEVFMVGFNFCPRGSAAAEGQLLPVAQNSALFSLFGTIYGGDGRTTFALPDLRGRTPVGAGAGPGLSNVQQGQKFGTESHSHSGAAAGTVSTTTVAVLNPNIISNSATDIKKVDVAATAGGSAGSASNTRPPQLVMRYCVQLNGVYPSRS